VSHPVQPTTTTTQSSTGASEGRSLGDIVSDITTDLSTLFKQEVDLAKTEMKEEATKAGKGATMLAAAGLLGLLVLFLISFALVYVLDNVMPVELAFLIVALLWGAVAAVLALSGKKALQQANPQLPETQRSLKEDAQWAKQQKS